MNDNQILSIDGGVNPLDVVETIAAGAGIAMGIAPAVVICSVVAPVVATCAGIAQTDALLAGSLSHLYG